MRIFPVVLFTCLVLGFVQAGDRAVIIKKNKEATKELIKKTENVVSELQLLKNKAESQKNARLVEAINRIEQRFADLKIIESLKKTPENIEKNENFLLVKKLMDFQVEMAGINNQLQYLIEGQDVSIVYMFNVQKNIEDLMHHISKKPIMYINQGPTEIRIHNYKLYSESFEKYLNIADDVIKLLSNNNYHDNTFFIFLAKDIRNEIEDIKNLMNDQNFNKETYMSLLKDLQLFVSMHMKYRNLYTFLVYFSANKKEDIQKLNTWFNLSTANVIHTVSLIKYREIISKAQKKPLSRSEKNQLLYLEKRTKKLYSGLNDFCQQHKNSTYFKDVSDFKLIVNKHLKLFHEATNGQYKDFQANDLGKIGEIVNNFVLDIPSKGKPQGTMLENILSFTKKHLGEELEISKAELGLSYETAEDSRYKFMYHSQKKDITNIKDENVIKLINTANEFLSTTSKINTEIKKSLGSVYWTIVDKAKSNSDQYMIIEYMEHMKDVIQNINNISQMLLPEYDKNKINTKTFHTSFGVFIENINKDQMELFKTLKAKDTSINLFIEKCKIIKLIDGLIGDTEKLKNQIVSQN